MVYSFVLQDLKGLLQDHQLWHKTKILLTNGSPIPLETMDSQLEAKDLDLDLGRGNREGVLAQYATLHELVGKGVSHRFALPITIQTAKT